MAKKTYEVEIKFKEAGAGQAEIVVPKVLKGSDWRYELVNGPEAKAIVQVEASTENHKAITADAACRSLSKKQTTVLKKTYPAPKLKRIYRELEFTLAPEETEGERILETFQTVRWRFHLIDIPIGAERSVYHVVPHKDSGEWHVKREGVARALGSHARKKDAVAGATQRAKKQIPSQVKIHKRDGTIQREYTYGDDPRKSPG